MENSLTNETREQIIRRYAKNRYDLRMHFKWRMWETALDDWRAGEEMLEREEGKTNR